MWDEYERKGLGLMANALNAGMRNTEERTSLSDEMTDSFGQVLNEGILLFSQRDILCPYMVSIPLFSSSTSSIFFFYYAVKTQNKKRQLTKRFNMV